MKKVLYILISQLIIIASTSMSFANDKFTRCMMDPRPSIVFRTSLGKLEYDFSKDRKELSHRAGRPILGRAERRTGATMITKSNAVKHGKGFCVAPKVIEIYVGIAKPVIFVASEFKKDTCYYNFVLRHEQAHMQTTIRLLERFVSVAPDMFKVAAKGVRPIYVTNASQISEASQILYDEYRGILDKMKEKFDEETEKEQEKIDAPELSNLIIEVCGKYYTKENDPLR